MALTKKAKSQIYRMILVNRKIRPSSTPFGILSSFYSGMKTHDIILKFSSQVLSKNPRKDVCRNMHYLHSAGLLEKRSSRPVSYDITEKGRWYVVASRLGLPLFSLILLANVYVFQKNMQKSGRPDFYVVGFFFERIRRFITHAYRVHGTLIKKNYVMRCANQTIRIPDDMVERLGEFDSDLRSIQRWYFDIGDEIDLFLIGNKTAENAVEKPITA